MTESKSATVAEFLLEVRVEEIPARMLPGAVKELASRLFEELMSRGLGPREVEAHYTPRRLIVLLRDFPGRETDRVEEMLGPPAQAAFDADGKPKTPAEAFAAKCGVEVGELKIVHAKKGKIESIVRRLGASTGNAIDPATEKGFYLSADRRIVGRETRDILAELVPRLLSALTWKKMMRWGTGIGPWVRPVHGIVALLDGAVVDFEFLGVASDRTTIGHPILSPAPFEVASVSDYASKLRAKGIVVSHDERKRILGARMAERAHALGGSLVPDDDLLTRLAAICEVPGVMEGSFDAKFSALPREVLTTSLRDHQSALSVEKDGKLVPVFLTVMDRADDPKGRVRAGNEWVVAARLADAEFFYHRDRSTPLAARPEQLASLAVHERLGSYAGKTKRLEHLATWIARESSHRNEIASVQEAARLAKVDLTTDLVREFTSLQGIIGGVYAREEGADEAVWQAVYDQYLPASTTDSLPRGSTGKILALADRIDALVGFFGLGASFHPTGSKDPFGLRRAALGVARILLESEIRVDLTGALEEAASLYRQQLGEKWGRKEKAQVGKGESAQAATELGEGSVPYLEALLSFLVDRLKFLLGDAGLAYDEVEAAVGAYSFNHDFPAARARATAIHELRGEKDFLSVVLAAKRIANIIKDQEPHEGAAALLVQPAEKALLASKLRLHEVGKASIEKRDFVTALRAVAELAVPLQKFFVDVLVMDPDESLKRARIWLLRSLGSEIRKVADLSAIVVDRADYRA